MLVSPPMQEAPDNVLVSHLTEKPLAAVLVCPPKVEWLVDVLASPQLEEPLEPRTWFPYLGGAPEARACSPSDGSVAGDIVCGDVARGSPDSFGGGGALGGGVAVSPEPAPL